MLHNYVISLAHANERREHIKQVFGEQNIAFTFFDALQPSEALNEAINEQLPALHQEPRMTEGEKACLMSHLALWQKCLDEQWPYIAIFEDDAILGKEAGKFLADDQWLQQNFCNHAYFLCLETVLRPLNLIATKMVLPHQGRQIMRLSSSNNGCGAYIISYEMISLLMSKINSLVGYELNPIDVLIYDQLNGLDGCNLYQLVPALSIQDSVLNGQNGLSSQLEQQRSIHFHNLPKKKRRRTVIQQVRHIISKPVRMRMKSKREIVSFV
ncbi:MAG: glycosyltransferase family 25 protein [Neisseria sp.]|nr:glycosyltransferase family 25 protein [Neisseria sp.]